MHLLGFGSICPTIWHHACVSFAVIPMTDHTSEDDAEESRQPSSCACAMAQMCMHLCGDYQSKVLFYVSFSCSRCESQLYTLNVWQCSHPNFVVVNFVCDSARLTRRTGGQANVLFFINKCISIYFLRWAWISTWVEGKRLRDCSTSVGLWMISEPACTRGDCTCRPTPASTAAFLRCVFSCTHNCMSMYALAWLRYAWTFRFYSRFVSAKPKTQSHEPNLNIFDIDLISTFECLADSSSEDGRWGDEPQPA